jgi:hypothetical protein
LYQRSLYGFANITTQWPKRLGAQLLALAELPISL